MIYSLCVDQWYCYNHWSWRMDPWTWPDTGREQPCTHAAVQQCTLQSPIATVVSRIASCTYAPQAPDYDRNSLLKTIMLQKVWFAGSSKLYCTHFWDIKC